MNMDNLQNLHLPPVYTRNIELLHPNAYGV
jgi:hypothetical protein